MRAQIGTSLIVALLSSTALAQDYTTTAFTATSQNTGITTTVRSVDMSSPSYPEKTAATQMAPVAETAPAPTAPVAAPAKSTTQHEPLLGEVAKPAATQMAPVVDGASKKTAAAPAVPTAAQPAAAPLVVVAQPEKTAAPAPEPDHIVNTAPAQPAPEPAMPAATPGAITAGTSLTDILSQAYATSPVLRAEREVLRQQYENVAIAESSRRPSLGIDGGVAAVNAQTRPGGKDNFISRDIGITGTQYLYRGGRTLAEIEQQLSVSDAAIAAYDAATQNVFLNVVTAAMDIQRDRATIELTEQNRTVIARSLESAQNGFNVGELTRTDVAQAQARLSGADAQLVTAKADYSSAVARYMQYAGMDGTALRVADDVKLVPVPTDLTAAKATADIDHPAIRSAVEEEKAAQSTIKLAQGGLKPDVYAQGTAGKSWDTSSLLDSQRDASIGVRAAISLYDGGLTRAQIRQAKYLQMEKRDRIEDARRVVNQQVATAWNDYQAAQAQISARAQQVDAAKLARDGAYNERQVGTRTVLDTLNADAELLDAQVGLVQARHDVVVAAYALQAATGQLTGEKLGLFSVDSEKQTLEKARKNWFGTSVQSAD